LPISLSPIRRHSPLWSRQHLLLRPAPESFFAPVVVEPTPLSASNPRIASLRRLSGRRKARREAGRFVIEGPVPIAELLAAGADLDELYVDLDQWAQVDDRSPLRSVVRDAVAAGVQVWGLTSSVFASVSDTATPQGVLALAIRSVAPVRSVADLDGPVLVLVDISDPGNAGTLVRAAEAAGCAGVVFAGASTDPFGPKAVRAAAGSIVRLPVSEGAEVSTVLDELRSAGRTLVATVVDGGAAPETTDLSVPVAILIGSEAHGLSSEVIAACSATITIPMQSAVESINAAVAGAVVLFEVARQRRNA
jgi:TrmH family RNA methyltransferase